LRVVSGRVATSSIDDFVDRCAQTIGDKPQLIRIADGILTAVATWPERNDPCDGRKRASKDNRKHPAKNWIPDPHPPAPFEAMAMTMRVAVGMAVSLTGVRCGAHSPTSELVGSQKAQPSLGNVGCW